MNNLKKYEYFKTDLGTLYCGDHLDILPLLEDNIINLTITSPPYDYLRDYITLKNKKFNYQDLSHLLYQKSASGGVVVWVVNDQTINKSETLTSFKQAIHFVENAKFKLHDTMIWLKDPSYPDKCRYTQAFEYMFIFVKENIKYFSPIQKKNINTNTRKLRYTRGKDGKILKGDIKYSIPQYGKLVNYVFFPVGWGKTYNEKFLREHPAIFPFSLVCFHIESWSDKNDIILDPMMGSGTVADACETFLRRWIGIEIEEEYCEIIKKRIEKHIIQKKLF